MLLDRFAESRALCEEAIAIARQVGARQAEGHAKNTLGVDLSGQGRPMPATRPCASRLAIAQEVNDVEGIARAYINLTDVLFLGGDIERAADVVDEADARRSRRSACPRTPACTCCHNGVLINAELGRWDKARRQADEAVRTRN